MQERLFTKASAEALLPEVRKRLSRMQEAFAESSERHEQVAPKVGGNGAGHHPDRWIKATRTLERDVRWFRDQGIILRDVGNGIIDFPAVRDGEDILLCWKMGEEDICFWHYPDAGFSGRLPL